MPSHKNFGAEQLQHSIVTRTMHPAIRQSTHRAKAHVVEGTSWRYVFVVVLLCPRVRICIRVRGLELLCLGGRRFGFWGFGNCLGWFRILGALGLEFGVWSVGFVWFFPPFARNISFKRQARDQPAARLPDVPVSMRTFQPTRGPYLVRQFLDSFIGFRLNSFI